MPDSPIAGHVATPAELQARLDTARDGAPFLVLRHPQTGQQLVRLKDSSRVTIGRRSECDLWLQWDGRVSRLHAELLCIGGEWIVADDGLSANGTWVNDSRLNGRRRLRDGDLIRVGDTLVAFCSPAEGNSATISVDAGQALVQVTPAQRRVLVALCRAYLATGRLTVPSNAEIAAELYISVDSVKTHMKALFEAFDLGELRSRVKRAELVERAVRNGVVLTRDIAGTEP
jgi:pSer/pThr/pTyr-binding forkhead associated (FHA) protein